MIKLSVTLNNIQDNSLKIHLLNELDLYSLFNVPATKKPRESISGL